MKMTVKREPFLNALSVATSIAPLRGARPSLKGALLMPLEGPVIEVQATDSEVGLRYRVKAEAISEPSSLCLPCATLSGLLRDCMDEVITVETEGAKGILKAGRDVFEILGHESSDFPEIPDLGDASFFSVTASDLAVMIDRTIFAAAREQARYAINGIYMVCKDKLLEMVSTNGKRMAYCRRKVKEKGGLEEGIIVPLKMMQEVRRLCDLIPGEEGMKVAVRGRNVIVASEMVTLSSLLVEGIFPKYQQVIPKDNDREVSFKKEEFGLALRKVLHMTSEDTRVAEFGFKPGTCTIQAQSPDKGSALVTTEAEYQGEPMSISFNPQYIQEFLKILGEETVRMEMKDPTRAVLFREGADYLYVMMPISPKE